MEEVVESIPTETMDDGFDSIDNVEENQTSEEETNEVSEPNETQEDNSEDEVDFKPLLEALSGKIKYNKESVNVESLEDLINGYQKGLNYDKKVQELENLQNSKLEKYAKQKAMELGITVDEYMNQVEEYEKQQEQARTKERLEEMLNNGVPEDVAKEVIATSQLRKQLQAKENELKAKEQEQAKEQEKKKEYDDFLKNFPDVNPEDIPKEVFEDAETSNLSTAYMKWKLNQLENQLSIARTNEKNKASSIKSVTETGKTQEKHVNDPFLEGFND